MWFYKLSTWIISHFGQLTHRSAAKIFTHTHPSNSDKRGHTPPPHTHTAISRAETDISLPLTFPHKTRDVSSPLSHCQSIKTRWSEMDRPDQRKSSDLRGVGYKCKDPLLRLKKKKINIRQIHKHTVYIWLISIVVENLKMILFFLLLFFIFFIYWHLHCVATNGIW